MRPYQHALSGNSKGLPDWEDQLSIHEFLDSTKYCCADRRHRVVLHHADLGAAIAERVFPDRSDVQQIVEQHLREDLGHVVRLADWWDRCQAGHLPQPIHRRVKDGPDGIARYVAGRQPGVLEPSITEVCRFLFSPLEFLSHDAHLALPILMNAAGPMIVRRVFGPPRKLDGTRFVDFGWIAEAAIFTAFGRVPDLGEVVRCWADEPVRQKEGHDGDF